MDILSVNVQSVRQEDRQVKTLRLMREHFLKSLSEIFDFFFPVSFNKLSYGVKTRRKSLVSAR